MKKRTLLYIPLVLLFAFAVSVLGIHYANLFKNFNRASDRQVTLPFVVINGALVSLKPEAVEAGFRAADRLVAIGGKKIEDDKVFEEEMTKLRPDEPVAVAVERKMENGERQIFDLSLTPQKRVPDSYAQIAVGLLFGYVMPTFCILLGFWVVFARPRDVLAWLLLLVLLGFSSVALEGATNVVIQTYTSTFFSTWALAMFLFGIYFPERWSIDSKLPWAKWILIVPLGLQVVFAMIGHVERLLGVSLFDYLNFLTKPYGRVAMPLNMLAMGLFFTALGHKSGTLENRDARRRMKLMLIGTTVAMTPSFFIILYRIVTGARGSFFDLVPFWFALFALVMMLLFPLTMAYVIVVHRAMDVRVVIRQGLQYALARNGVKILQFILLVAVIVGVIWIFRSNNGFSVAEQIGFVAAGFALIPLIDYAAKNLRVWIDRKFFREAYNAEQILSDLSEEVRTMVETRPLLETVSAKISESLHVPQIALLLKNGSGFYPAYAVGYENQPSIELSETDVTVEKLKKNEPLVVYHDEDDSWVNEEARTEEREKLRKLNTQLLLPIGGKNELSGVISLSPKLSEEPFSPNDLRLLKSVAVQTGLALENSRLTETIAREAAQKERLNRELEIAREVQERLFPQELPSIELLDYTGACRPALGVGGDYYDFLELPDKKFGIAIGDVSGKGIGASLMMASLQASLRGQAIHCGDDLAGLMKHVNTLLYEASTSNRYATFFYAQFDTATKKMTYVNAGHNPPFLLRKKGADFEVMRLEDGGAVVGMLPSMFINYQRGEIQLEAGDLLVGYTDGISEAMNPLEEEWGEDAMLEEIKKVYEKRSEEILNHIVACADSFADGAKQHDDMTMIIVKVMESGK